MHEFLNEDYVDEESFISYQHANIIISLFFAIFDFVIIVVSSLNLKSKNDHISILKHKLIKLFIIDIINRILYTRKKNYKGIFGELISSVMSTSQFYFVISFIDEVSYISKNNILKNTQSILEAFKLCFIFFITTFSYENIHFTLSVYLNVNNFTLTRIIILIQSFIIIFWIYKLSKKFKEKVTQIGNHMMNSQTAKKRKIYLIILGSPNSCMALFIIYYALKIIFIFIKNPEFILYANIVLNILKGTCIYYVFLLCELIIYILNKTKKEKEEQKRKVVKINVEEGDKLMKE